MKELPIKQLAYRHAEAYRLMTYQCEVCGVEETIWNSRDGMTPFLISCRKCDGVMQHVRWHEDQLAVDHVPEPGQRVFIDMPESLKAPLARAQVARHDGTEYEVSGAQREAVVQSIVEGYGPGSPWLITWPDNQNPESGV